VTLRSWRESGCRDPLALAEDPQGPLAGRDPDVVDVEGDDLADAGAGVEGDEGNGLASLRATENTTVVKDLLVGLRERGLDTTRPILCVLDGPRRWWRR